MSGFSKEWVMKMLKQAETYIPPLERSTNGTWVRIKETGHKCDEARVGKIGVVINLAKMGEELAFIVSLPQDPGGLGFHEHELEVIPDPSLYEIKLKEEAT
jgi:hypothetical protein